MLIATEEMPMRTAKPHASTVIHSVRLEGVGARDAAQGGPGWVLLRGARIAATGPGSRWREVADDDAVIVDGRELAGDDPLLTPGLVDIHNHGAAGRTHGDGAAAIAAIAAFHAAAGTTRIVASLVSAGLPELALQLEAVRTAQLSVPGLIGAHLEGPFLQPARRGAHDPAALRTPDRDAVERLLAPGGVVQVTIAPELPGGPEAIAQVVAMGAVAAIGHSDADFETARAAFAAGASLVTHAFNAMPPLHHRAPGLLGAALDDPGVTLEAIPDGVHLHASVLAVLLRAAPGRVALVTDATAAAGLGDGATSLGGLEVEVRDGVATLPDGTIAGSSITLSEGVRRAVAAGIPVADAVVAATATPARALCLERTGTLEPGAHGDAVLWDAGLGVRAVWQEGRRLDVP